MGLSSNETARAAQLANLRPVSRSPETARAAGLAYGIGSGRHTLCGKIKKDGKPCRNIAAFGTPRCIKHGARQYAGTPPSPNRASRAAMAALAASPPCPELQRTPAWAATETLRLGPQALRRAALVAAWDALQEGNPAPWRTLIKTT